MPKLIIVAGCNGAGKSTFSRSYLPEGLTPFDYDKRFLEIYKALPDSELREKFAKDQASREFEGAVSKSIETNTDFCYETNFDVYPVFWAGKFKDKGYGLNLVFFCLENQEIAHRRVQIRTENKGHFIDCQTLKYKWKAGYKNVNINYGFFDNILLVDNSVNNRKPVNLLQTRQGEIELLAHEIPEYFERRFPDIFKRLKSL